MKRFILWFTGLPGSGKTALSRKLSNHLKKLKIKNIVIDGDNFRKKILNFKYDDLSREYIGYMKLRKAIDYYDKGYFVIISGVAYKKKWRDNIRVFSGNRRYKEIYLDCSVENCIKRNKEQNKNKLLQKSSNYKYEKSRNFDIKLKTDLNGLDITYKNLKKILNI